MIELNYDDWYEENEQSLIEQFAETGQDREACFDLDEAAEQMYEAYLQNLGMG